MSATGPLDPSELLAAQRRLRDRLLSGHTDDAARRERDLAAEMLLHLDDARSCWAICARWLLPVTGADRIDAGFSSGRSAWYRPEFEVTRADVVLPKVLDAAMDARDNGIAAVWASSRVVIFDDVASDARLGPGMRATLLAAGTARKLAVALRDRGRDVGLLCVDARSSGRTWHTDAAERLDHAARHVIAPILGTARRWTAWEHGPGERVGPASLTAAEQRVAQLVLAGCSYKEIARRLDRSTSTVDHQLRSMRNKLGVNSTAKLIRELLALSGPG